jgi:hypothetical protein
MSHQENITRIRAVRNALGDLKDDVVFVGGATVSLYTDRRTEDVRPTDDIDVGFIRIFQSPYFIASKLEAFKSRGANDGRTSTDFEDIIFVLENNSQIWEEIEKAEKEVKQYLKNSFQSMLDNIHFEEWVNAHAGYGITPATNYILERLNELVNP